LTHGFGYLAWMQAKDEQHLVLHFRDQVETVIAPSNLRRPQIAPHHTSSTSL
jgi:hypothetical protein